MTAAVLAAAFAARSPVPWTLPGAATMALAMVAFATVGAMIAQRHPVNPIGWLFAAVGAFGAGALLAEHYAAYALARAGVGVPGAAIAAWIHAWLTPVAVVPPITFGFLWFPDGHVPSRRWRPVTWLAACGLVTLAAVLAVAPGPFDTFPEIVNPFGLAGVSRETLGLVATPAFLLLLVCILASAAGLVTRLRRARADERQQLKWFAFAAALLAVFIVGSGLASLLADVDPGPVFHGVGLASLPIAAGFAILRYRLYDIDRIISRTVGYAVLTGLLGSVYIATVVLLGEVLRPSTQGSSIAIAASTLAVAALVRPARRHVQAIVDRQFDRARYDAEHTVEVFRVRLRDEIDLDQMSADLLASVYDTVRPAQVAIWLRPARGSHPP